MFVNIPGILGKNLNDMLNTGDRKTRWTALTKYAGKKGLTSNEIRNVILGPHRDRKEHYAGIMSLIGKEVYQEKNELPF